MKLLALKIDVDTYHGTLIGVPALVKVLQCFGANATFLFSLGPDHTGRAIKRVFRPGFMKKVSRTSVVEHYGIKTLLYGTLLPGPDIGKNAGPIMRHVRDAGFEVGIHTYDHITWQDYVAGKDATWTQRQMRLACDSFEKVFGEPARTHGAAGWQMNRNAYRFEQAQHYPYCSDTRGTHPFIPVYEGEIIACPQVPTTLPTLDELIGVGDLTPDNVAQHLLKLTEQEPATGHVYTLHAELEGRKLLPVFETLLTGWQAQGYQLVSTLQLFESLDLSALPYHKVIMGEIEGRSGTLALQGPEFLA
ncbi:4-deoxy-4-formamido-L-arabinose-phosphoundecaprenol deformylase [Chitinivorax sp. B]|uniref:4-deoxy-4-formamido-L-arabinose- phosphoundecaprenol deformylase n=1 Tax=Chitinivorax sp. B TaxID=2502235 RepID=UPI0010F587CB|nr:4-deoxy-4-formamido-L-arabinose-phosphoundecaprenol deformylase [Chitinivorax sp. B]